jgi:FKBP-type peptidyl-prolyl cis-trans isomerase FkpA
MKKLFVLLTALAFGLGLGCTKGCSDKKEAPVTTNEGNVPDAGDSNMTDKSSKGSAAQSNITDLVINDIQEGDGSIATAGQTVEVHYTGWLYDPNQPENKGTKFDSSVDRGQTFKFPLGAGRVISGWDKGVAGMKVKGKRTLVIPPHMAYGEQGAGDVIPANSTLVFDVELIGVGE